MDKFALIVINQPWYVLVVGSLLTLISVGFLDRFVLPAWRLGRELKKSIKALASVQERVSGSVVELDDIAREAMTMPMLAHLWSEYSCRRAFKTTQLCALNFTQGL